MGETRSAASDGTRFTTAGIADIAPDGVDAPTVPLLLGLAILVVRLILAPILDGTWNDVASSVSQSVIAALACSAVVLGLRTAVGSHRHYGLRVLLGLILVLILSIAEITAAVAPANEWVLVAIFGGAVLLTVVQLTPLVASGLSRPVLVAAWLDMLIFFAAGVAVVGSIADWQRLVVSDATVAVVACLIGMLAWTITAASMLFARGVRVRAGGPFVLFGGLALVSFTAVSWIARVDTLPLDRTVPVGALFSIGTLMIARGWLTWSFEAYERRSAWLVEVGRDMASTTAIMLAILVVLIGPRADDATTRLGMVSELALAAAVVVAGVRQVAIKEFERRARSAQVVTSARLATEISERGRVSWVLEGMEPAASVKVTAENICQRLLSLPGADFAIITALADDGDATPLAAAGLVTFGLVGQPLTPSHVDHLRSRAPNGIWTESASPWLDAWLPIDDPGGKLRAIRAPLVWDEQLVGILAVGTHQKGDVDEADREVATIREAAVLVAALVGPPLASEMASRRKRERIERVIRDQAFFPVYQPIVNLVSEQVVGFEALTRFADGGRPDVWFLEAAAAGRGVELEAATLSAAVREAIDLPSDCYLSLNLSPDLAASVDILGRALTRLPRAVLLEITEHVPVEDYDRLMANLYALDIQIRIAVDDAGAGYAGLQHILAIHPHVVKLDAGLVRSVDLDAARQAIVGAMVSFAARTGATIVAEGVETVSEVAMLRSLGVSFAQGYYFGRPRRATEWREQP